MHHGFRELHDKAMDLAEEAFADQKRGVPATEKFQRALRMELQAASLISEEPSRSILYKSAAALTELAKMQIIHISEDRFNRIKSQGYQFKQMEYAFGDGPSGTFEMEMPGSCIYHFLPAEKAICPICEKEFDSVKAETPAELETAKMLQSSLMCEGNGHHNWSLTKDSCECGELNADDANFPNLSPEGLNE